MKKFKFIIYIIFISSSNTSTAQVALDSMLTACYPFTGDALDMSGNSHHGTVFGATLTTDRFGNPNCAYHFNGVNNYIEVQRFDSLVPGDEVSLSFWCRVHTLASHAQFQIQPDDPADRFNVSIHYSHNGIPSTFWDYGSIYGTGRYDTLYMPFVTQWEHYVFISSAAQNLMAEYKDGVLVKMNQQHDVILNKMKPLWIGKGSTLACLDGEIDDIRFYNRILNDSEIVALYNSQAGCIAVQPPVADFLTADSTICQSECINFNNFSLNATSYQWFFPGAVPAVSIDADPQNICYNTSGDFDVTLIATNSVGSDTLIFINYISVLPYSAQGIIQSGDTLISNPGFISYQWYFNGSLIPGATNNFYIALQDGNYSVICINEYGCQVEAVIFNVLAGFTVPSPFLEGISIYPNPVTDNLNLLNLNYFKGDWTNISIFDILGNKVYSAIGFTQSTIDCRHFPPGIYLLEINYAGKNYHVNFVKSSCR
ncbi:hypothetical protein BH11BAC1_BH11BAC1_09560 [soil metagenome]